MENEKNNSRGKFLRLLVRVRDKSSIARSKTIRQLFVYDDLAFDYQ